MPTLKLTIWLLLFSITLAAQIQISGYVTDASSGEPLIGVSVYCSQTQHGQATNAYGYYSINITKDNTYSLSFSFIGYKTYVTNSSTLKNSVLNIQLKPGINLQEVSVSGTTPIEKRSEISTLQLSMKEVCRLPSLGGESDLIKALQLLPGISQGSEGSSGMYVRGGSPDQNLILLDDVPMYYVNHLGGFVSTFNPDAINSAKVIKGGFPARFGSRLSSVLDIRMKNGDMTKHKGNATIGLVSSKFMVEGPIKKDTASYLISARRMMYDLLTRPLTPLLFNNVSMGYNFYDINVKLNYKPSYKDRLFLSFYSGDDRSVVTYKDNDNDIDTANKLRWGNTLGAIRWNHIYSPKIFSNITASYTQYRNTTKQDYEGTDYESNYEFLSKVSDLSLKADFEIYAKSFYTLRAGSSVIYHAYQPTQIQNAQNIDGIATDSTLINYFEEALETNLYIENELNLFSKLKANIGLRYTSYIVSEQGYHSFEPRLALNYSFIPGHSIKLGYAQMQQNIHLLTNNGIGMSSDYWLPATKKLTPELSWQYSIGWAHTTQNNGFEMSLESYYKKMNNLISFKDGISNFSGTQNWQEQIESNGNGTSKGIECFIKKNKGYFTGWVGYTLSKTTRQFDNQNDGKTYSFKYDRLHDISIVLQHQLTPKIDLFASWVYHTGNAITLSTEHYRVPHETMDYTNDNTSYVEIDIYKDRNSSRMKAYHKLDVGINFVKEKKNGFRTWNISVYNLYNKQNAYYYFWSNEISEDYETNKKKKLYQMTMFPFIPSASYSFTF